jgi:Arm DNA-binding domain
MRARLTELGIRRLRAPEKDRLEVWDTLLPGFGVRATPTGHKTFMAMYRARGVQRRLTLGNYPAVTLAAARKLARKAFAEVAEGRDPSVEKRERRGRGKADSFRAVAAEYLERHAKRHKRSWREDERLINRELLPQWGTRRISEISKADVLKLIDATSDRAPIMANRLLALIRKDAQRAPGSMRSPCRAWPWTCCAACPTRAPTSSRSAQASPRLASRGPRHGPTRYPE